MKVKTSRFGEMDIPAERILTAAARIPGFPNHKQFFVIESSKIEPFRWFQSVEDSSLTFVIVEPRAFFHNYKPWVDEADLELLEIKSFGEGKIYLIVVLPEDLTKMTANLKAPIIINEKTGKFKQVFVLNEEYTHAHNILEAIQAQEKAKLDSSRKQGDRPESDGSVETK